MTSTSMARPMGNVAAVPEHTSTEFGAFVLLSKADREPVGPKGGVRSSAGLEENTGTFNLEPLE